MDIKSINEKYASLVLDFGLNLDKGRGVLITTPISAYDFALELARQAYDRGAGYVHIKPETVLLDKYRSTCQTREQMAEIPGFIADMFKYIGENDWATISIDPVSSDNVKAALDREGYDAYRSELLKVQKPWRDKAMCNQSPWCVVAYPDDFWSSMILGQDKKAVDLFERLLPILHLDSEDPVAMWKKDSDNLQARRARLTKLGIESLHYTSSVTDLTIGLGRKAVFQGGSADLPDGRWFNPNIPTAEVFSAPDKYMAEGYVKTTRPVSVKGESTLGVTLTFRDGKVIDVKAEEGLDVMQRYLAKQGADRIGEVALVDESSPIAQAGLVFKSILYDENASCHIALGAGYPDCISSAIESEADYEANHLNHSLEHTDFMIGSRDMDIEATTYDGKTVQIMRKGRFTI